MSDNRALLRDLVASRPREGRSLIRGESCEEIPHGHHVALSLHQDVCLSELAHHPGNPKPA